MYEILLLIFGSVAEGLTGVFGKLASDINFTPDMIITLRYVLTTIILMFTFGIRNRNISFLYNKSISNLYLGYFYCICIGLCSAISWYIIYLLFQKNMNTNIILPLFYIIAVLTINICSTLILKEKFAKGKGIQNIIGNFFAFVAFYLIFTSQDKFI
jgi:drug/metabolite transporter (DMT)-like permease